MDKPKIDAMIRRCPVHGVQLKDGEANCWRCRTLSVEQMNNRKFIMSTPGKSIEIKGYTAWIFMN
jgi:hypothetical protein